MTSLAQWVPVAVRHHTVGRVGRPRSVSEGPGVLSLLLRPLERRGDSPRDGSRKSWRDTHALARHTARLVKWYGGIIHRCARLIGAAQPHAWPAMVVLTHPRRAATNLVLFAVSGLCPLTAVDAQAAWGEYRLGRLSSILVRERAAALASAHGPETIITVSGTCALAKAAARSRTRMLDRRPSRYSPHAAWASTAVRGQSPLTAKRTKLVAARRG